MYDDASKTVLRERSYLRIMMKGLGVHSRKSIFTTEFTENDTETRDGKRFYEAFHSLCLILAVGSAVCLLRFGGRVSRGYPEPLKVPNSPKDYHATMFVTFPLGVAFPC